MPPEVFRPPMSVIFQGLATARAAARRATAPFSTFTGVVLEVEETVFEEKV